ncbi:MAG: polysaccharide deacetylase family protein [Crocinitomicaceae bacterium]|nr:polysaccharide deacetylase family protein [Crocinitomicaceae bacterium]MBK8927623.1 polysaccharide deacetylase family protein [Crocinitomicaceae bacterium]
MRIYKIPKWLRRFYPNAIWDFFSSPDKTIYLTFDDGPTSETTCWLLNLLAQHKIRVSFFCLGKNASLYPDLIQKMRDAGHAIGNHGYFHLDGFKTKEADYIENAEAGFKIIPTTLYRPAYGRISPGQYEALTQMGYRLVFWSHLTYDFDDSMTSSARISKIKSATKPGAIFVFHDSQKAFSNLKYELPVLIKYWKSEGYMFGVV